MPRSVPWQTCSTEAEVCAMRIALSFMACATAAMPHRRDFRVGRPPLPCSRATQGRQVAPGTSHLTLKRRLRRGTLLRVSRIEPIRRASRVALDLSRPPAPAPLLPSARRVLSGSYDGELRMWDLVTNNTQQAYMGHEGPVPAAQLSPRPAPAAGERPTRVFFEGGWFRGSPKSYSDVCWAYHEGGV